MIASSQLAMVVRGTLIDCAARETLRVLRHSVVGVDASGKICFVEHDHPEPLEPDGALLLREGEKRVALGGVSIVDVPPRGFLVPGLIDTHTHAPQIVNAGKGYDLQLLEWLEQYTFPCEERFGEAEYAETVCKTAVRRTLENGSTTCVYFG